MLILDFLDCNSCLSKGQLLMVEFLNLADRLTLRCTLCYCTSVVKMVMWSRGRGLTWRSQVRANPILIPHPINLSLFGHKI